MMAAPRSGSSILTCGHCQEACLSGSGAEVGLESDGMQVRGQVFSEQFPFLARSDSWCPGVFPGLCSAVAGSSHMAIKGHIPYIPNNCKEVGMGGWTVSGQMTNKKE